MHTYNIPTYYSKPANLYVRKLLPEEVGFLRVFSDLKTFHVVPSHNIFMGHDFDLGEWVKVANGRDSPALNGKCSAEKVKKIKDNHFRHRTV